MAKFPDGWRAVLNVPILFSWSQAGSTRWDAFSAALTWGTSDWIDGHGFRNVNRVLLLRCDDPCPVSLFANSVTLELKQNPRLVRARRE
jgi:hypothetical protein